MIEYFPDGSISGRTLAILPSSVPQEEADVIVRETLHAYRFYPFVEPTYPESFTSFKRFFGCDDNKYPL